MFKIYDGREFFYQWDLDRKLIVDDKNIKQVHFCNRTDDCSLVCETYTEDGLNLVNVPNVLLQEDWRINVYAYDFNYTKHSDVFNVVRRSKPESYVYTETETLNYNVLLDRMNTIDKNLEQSINDYFIENPVEVDLTGYATEEYVGNAIAAIPEPDLSDYALKSEIPSTTGLATEKYVDDKIANIDISGGNSGSSNIYVFEKSHHYFTDNDKAKIQEIFDYMTANGKMMECELWYPFTSSNPIKITSVVKGSQGLELFLANINDGYKRSIYCVFSNGIYSYCYQNEEQKGGDWRWSDDSGLSSIGSYSLIKVVGYFNGNTSAIGTMLITTSNGNTFDSEYGTHYYSTWAYESNIGTIDFYNQGSSLEVYSFNSDNGETFTILGYYYWG